jgi:hypothetical protein
MNVNQILMRSLFTFLILLLPLLILGQQSIPATGGNSEGSGGTVSYTVGQLVYTTNSGSGGSSSQGVQQPFEIWVTTSIEPAKDISLLLSAYPNPTNDRLTLQIENYESLDLSYKLFDANGKLLESKKITGPETEISVLDLFSAIYFLKVIDSQTEIKTFKIIKN